MNEPHGENWYGHHRDRALEYLEVTRCRYSTEADTTAALVHAVLALAAAVEERE